MSVNVARCWLEAHLSTHLIHLSKTVATGNFYFDGPGGVSGDGIPIPLPGVIKSMSVWDGTTLHTSEPDPPLEIAAGERFAMYGTYDDPYFIIGLTVDGGSVSMPAMEEVLPNTDLFATIELLIKRPNSPED